MGFYTIQQTSSKLPTKRANAGRITGHVQPLLYLKESFYCTSPLLALWFIMWLTRVMSVRLSVCMFVCYVQAFN